MGSRSAVVVGVAVVGGGVGVVGVVGVVGAVVVVAADAADDAAADVVCLFVCC